MNWRSSLLLAVVIGMIGVAYAWLSGRLAGRPLLETSGLSGSERVFTAGEARCLTAISNAFSFARYHEMMLSDAVGLDYLASNWHPTNGFALIPTLDAVGTIPTRGILGTRKLKYWAAFHITTRPLGSEKTVIRVRTVASVVLDGLTVGHGGVIANSAKVPPVCVEEQRVLDAIEMQLGAVE